jgi:histidine triad (HIT) family protein
MKDIQDCIFCKIIAHELPAKRILENPSVLVIEDIAPKAPIHYLIIPKKHISMVAHLQPDDGAAVQAVFYAAQELGKQLSGSQAYRLIINNGKDAGQSVFHLHCHFIANKIMSDF